MNSHQIISEEILLKFSNIISNKIQKGFILEEENHKLPFVVLLKEETQVNHSFNFLLCCITLGIWSVAWIYLSYASKAKKILVAIDEDGNIFEENCYIR